MKHFTPPLINIKYIKQINKLGGRNEEKQTKPYSTNTWNHC